MSFYGFVEVFLACHSLTSNICLFSHRSNRDGLLPDSLVSQQQQQPLTIGSLVTAGGLTLPGDLGTTRVHHQPMSHLPAAPPLLHHHQPLTFPPSMLSSAMHHLPTTLAAHSLNPAPLAHHASSSHMWSGHHQHHQLPRRTAGLPGVPGCTGLCCQLPTLPPVTVGQQTFPSCFLPPADPRFGTSNAAAAAAAASSIYSHQPPLLPPYLLHSVSAPMPVSVCLMHVSICTAKTLLSTSTY